MHTISFGFKFAYLSWLMKLGVFSRAHLQSLYPFHKRSLHDFCLCFNWIVLLFLLLSFENSLYSLCTCPSLDVCFANISCHPSPFTGSLAEQKFLIWVKFSLLIFPFKDHSFGIKSKDSLPIFRSQRFSYVFSSSYPFYI